MEFLLNDKNLLFLLEMFLKSSLIFLLAFATLQLVKNSSAFIKHFILFLSFICVFLLPFFSKILPNNGFSIFHKAPVSIQENITLTETTSQTYIYVTYSNQLITPIKNQKENAFLNTLNNVITYIENNKTFILYSLWISGMLFFLLKIGFGLRKINSLTKHGEQVDGSPWIEFLSLFARKTGFSGKVEVVKSKGVSVPMTWSLKSNFIIFPKSVDKWTDKQKAAAFLHELSHIKRRDFIVFMFAKATCILFWFNPLSFIALKKLRFEQENSCDELVVSLGLRASSYAMSLLEIGKNMTHYSNLEATALCMAKKSELQKRLTTILEKKSYFKEIKMKTKIFITLVLFIGLCTISSTGLYSNAADFTGQFNNNDNMMLISDKGNIEEPDEPEKVQKIEKVEKIVEPPKPEKPAKIECDVKVTMDEDVDDQGHHIIIKKKHKNEKTGKTEYVVIKKDGKDSGNLIYTDKDGKTHVIKSKNKLMFVGEDEKFHKLRVEMDHKKLEEMHKKLEMENKKLEEMHKKLEAAMEKINSKEVKKEIEMAMKEYEKSMKSMEKIKKEELHRALKMESKLKHNNIFIDEFKHSEKLSDKEIEEIVKNAKKNKLSDKEIEEIVKHAKESIPSEAEIKIIMEDAKKNIPTKEEIEKIVKEAKENDLSDKEIEKILKEAKEKSLKEFKFEDHHGRIVVMKDGKDGKKYKKIIIKKMDGDEEDNDVVWFSDDDEDHELIEIIEGEGEKGKVKFTSKDGKDFTTTEILQDKDHKGDLKLKFNNINGKLKTDKDIEFKKHGEKTGLNVTVEFEAEFSKNHKSELKKMVKNFEKQLPKDVKVDYKIDSDECSLTVKSKKDIEGKLAENVLEEIKKLEKEVSKLVNN